MYDPRPITDSMIAAAHCYFLTKSLVFVLELEQSNFLTKSLLFVSKLFDCFVIQEIVSHLHKGNLQRNTVFE